MTQITQMYLPLQQRGFAWDGIPQGMNNHVQNVTTFKLSLTINGLLNVLSSKLLVQTTSPSHENIMYKLCNFQRKEKNSSATYLS